MVCGADEGYSMPLAVTLHSALSNVSDNTEIDLYVVDGGFSPDTRSRLERVVRTSSHGTTRLHWATVNPSFIDELPTGKWVTASAYLRLFIPELLPSTTKKALYLDSDVLVEADLTALWEKEMDNAPILAAQDFGAPYVSSALGLTNYQELNLPPDAPYFNSGVLALNLPIWRRENITQQTLDYLKEYREHVRFLDQDGLNAVLAQRWKPLPPRWNVMSHLIHFENWSPSPFKEKIRSRRHELLTNAALYHFAGGSKPWQIGCTHPAQWKWVRTLWSSNWFTANERLQWFGEWVLRYSWWRAKRKIGLIQ